MSRHAIHHIGVAGWVSVASFGVGVLLSALQLAGVKFHGALADGLYALSGLLIAAGIVGAVLSGRRRGGRPAMTERTVTVHVSGSGNIGYVENLNQTPQPKLHIRQIAPPKPEDDGLYHWRYELTLEASYALPGLRAIALGQSVEKMNFGPKGGGAIMNYCEWDMNAGGKAVSFTNVSPNLALDVAMSSAIEAPTLDFDTTAYPG